MLQLEALAFGDAERVNVFLDAVEDFFSRHIAIFLLRGSTLRWARLPGRLSFLTLVLVDLLARSLLRFTQIVR
jgi:hypothetical protein